MTTRLQMRTLLRRHLSDTGANPLWDEPFLNDAIAEAVRRYGIPLPRQAVAAVPVASGDREVDLPGHIDATRVVNVFDDLGQPWRRCPPGAVALPAPVGEPDGLATWRAWGTALILGAAASRTGAWRIEHLASRAAPLDDDTALDIQPGDDDLVLSLAIAVALHRRAVDDGKRHLGRSGEHPLASAARTAQVDADRLLWHRLRHVRGGSLDHHVGGVAR